MSKTRVRSHLLLDLWRDQRGNAAIIMAAAFFPILGLIGSGLDLSRAYLVKSRLQTACDAGSLAARRAMASQTLDDAAIAEGERFFAFNFPEGTMNAAPADVKIEANPSDVSTVDMKASTTVPTTIMSLFGVEDLPIAVECSADQDYVNNDIMLVLDVTGSMNCKAGSNCDYSANEQSNARVARLRTATAALYRVLQDAKGVRTRYGFMPYSMTVNVGRSLQSGWLRNPANYWVKSGNNWSQVSTNHSSTWFSFNWSGCLEERSTISQGTGAAIKISSDVAQTDIDTTSSSTPALQWAPYDENATVGETGTYANLTSFCPAAASKLTTYDSEGAFQSAVNSSLSKVGGYTNHDLGIMWGMRFLSSSGMFASENPTTFNQVPVAKHIIFLTDGVMTADTNNYNAYGISSREMRLTGSASLVQKHKNRFLNACSRAQQMGATIWVIAVDVSATADIQSCASGSDRFFSITTNQAEDYEKVFQQIGKGIGRLRLTS